MRREGMRIVIPDDYQDAVRHLACFEILAGHQVTVYHDHTENVETLATRFQEADALVLISIGKIVRGNRSRRDQPFSLAQFGGNSQAE
jgi:acyl-coenzyme A synthetase/AMP-(fatty) acid ligase